jgi:alkylated DNA repair dioxygenase AlkB
MASALQNSLLDLAEVPQLCPLPSLLARTQLTDGAWIDRGEAWVRGSAALFERLMTAVPWRAERRPMYDRIVDVPRLLCFYGEDDPLPDPLLTAARVALSDHYLNELGEAFVTAGLCLYRDGRDSVAWHGDTIGRGRAEDTMVAILSLGAPRALSLRPRARAGQTRGDNLRLNLGHGDLMVMGGSCQRTWEHAVPKTTRSVGPRISIQFRTRGVR